MYMCNVQLSFLLIRVHLFSPVALLQKNNSEGGSVSLLNVLTSAVI